MGAEATKEPDPHKNEMPRIDHELREREILRRQEILRREREYMTRRPVATYPPLIVERTIPFTRNVESKQEQDKKMFYKLKSMFPLCDENDIKNLLTNPPFDPTFYSKSDLLELFAERCLEFKTNNSGENLITEYVTSNNTIDDVYNRLKAIFPDANMNYLYRFASRNYTNNAVIDKFIEDMSKNPKYPKDDKCLERAELRKNFIHEFNVEKFVEIFEDPEEYFKNPKRKGPYQHSIVVFIKKVYNVAESKAEKIYKDNNFNLSCTIKNLNAKLPFDKRKKNYELEILLNINDVNLLLEVVYLKNEENILKYIEKKGKEEYKEIRRCIKNHSFEECQCCFVDYIPSRIMTCNKDDKFCKACMIKSFEVKLSDGNYNLDCILKCGGQFSIADIKKILKPDKFRKFTLKWQENEVRNAQIEGLVSCPFCFFAIIPPKDEKMFQCQNPECMKISCRLCQKAFHAPDPCEAKVKARHRLEEEMTNALVRSCYRCKLPYIKTDGCNHIICGRCGAEMCYICQQPIRGYAHFNNGGQCKASTDNIKENEGKVNAAARITASEILKLYPDLKKDTDKLLSN